MILGKQLLDNGQTHDAKGLAIDPGAPYEQSSHDPAPQFLRYSGQ